MVPKERLSGLALLAVFLMGGLVGPTLHHIEHTRQRQAQQEQAAASCAHDVHEAPAYEAFFASLSDQAPCWLCTRNLVASEGGASALSHQHVPASPLALHDSVREGAASIQHFIRGPPARS